MTHSFKGSLCWHIMKISIKLPSGNTTEGSVDKQVVTIGRSNKADFVVNDESLSRIHCEVEISESQFYVTDLGSANGVYLDGTRLEANKKTPFSTFMQLMIGALECSVQDIDSGLQLDFKDDGEKAQGSNHATNVNLVLDKKNRPPPLPKKKNQPVKAKGVNPALLLVGLTVVLAVIYFSTKSQNPFESSIEESSITSTPASPAPIKKLNTKPLVPNEFSSKEMYIAAESKKSCSEDSPICKELQLTSANQEGIYSEGPEIYIFFKPSKLLKQPHLSPMREKPNADEVISNFMILSSSIMEKLENQEYEQVHLIMLDDQNRMVKVFRYHASKFEAGSNERFDLIESISTSIRAQDIQEIAHILDLKIPSKTLE